MKSGSCVIVKLQYLYDSLGERSETEIADFKIIQLEQQGKRSWATRREDDLPRSLTLSTVQTVSMLLLEQSNLCPESPAHTPNRGLAPCPMQLPSHDCLPLSLFQWSNYQPGWCISGSVVLKSLLPFAPAQNNILARYFCHQNALN